MIKETIDKIVDVPIHNWLDGFALLKLGMAEVYAVGILVLLYSWEENSKAIW